MITNNRYKTVMCRFWEQGSSCPLNQKCHYAHGPGELRKIGDVNLKAISK